jgi:hypothetical protein
MRVFKIIAVVLLVYVGIVVVFESLLGYFQPEAGNTMVITTFDEQGNGADRVVSKLESDGNMYVAANHWPRAWYRQALKNPEVKLTMDGETHDYVVVPIDDAEFERVHSENPVGAVGRFLMGYPPRRIVRLDPA